MVLVASSNQSKPMFVVKRVVIRRSIEAVGIIEAKKPLTALILEDQPI